MRPLVGVALVVIAAAVLFGAPRPPDLAWPDEDRLWQGVAVRPTEDVPEGGRRVEIEVAGVHVLVTDPSGTTAVRPGDTVRFLGRPHPPRGYADEGAFDRERFLLARGIQAVAVARPPGLVAGRDSGASGAWRLAGWLGDRGAARLARARDVDADGAALLAALVLGRRGEVAPHVEQAFRRAGVSHVLSVSGLHLAAVAMLLFALVRWLWIRGPWAARVGADRVAALVAAPSALLYTLVTGAEVATVRSLVCVFVVLFAKATARRVDALAALAAAALIVVAGSPLAVFDPSFQLSFAAAAALALLAERRLRVPGPRLVRYIGQMLLASAAAQAATAPLTALHFGVLQPAGLLANLVVVPLAELVVLPLGLLAAIFGGPLVPLAGAASALLSRLVAVIASVSPVIDVPPPTPWQLAALGAAVIALLVGRWRAAIPALVVFALTLVPHARRELEVTFLDVGQGDAALIETPAGEAWLIDAGGRLFGAPDLDADEDERLLAEAGDPGEQVIRRVLAARRITRLALVVISHPHPDHYGGLLAVAAHVRIDEVWLSGDDAGDPRFRALLGALALTGTRITRAPPGTVHTAGAAELRVLAPPSAATADASSTNDASLVARLAFGGRKVLFPGDLEAPGEAALLSGTPDIGVDVVKVPHHGSRTSSSPAFVAATRPRLVVMSLADHNRFHFPAPEVVARWQAAGARVARTDVDGAVTLRIAPDGAFSASGRRTGIMPLP